MSEFDNNGGLVSSPTTAPITANNTASSPSSATANGGAAAAGGLGAVSVSSGANSRSPSPALTSIQQLQKGNSNNGVGVGKLNLNSIMMNNSTNNNTNGSFGGNGALARSVSSMTIGGFGSTIGGYNQNQQQLQQQQQHVVDDDIAFVDSVFSRVFNNLSLFKIKVMFNCDIPLSETEQLSILEGKEMDAGRVSSFKEAVRQVQESIMAKRKANIGFTQLTNIGNLFGGGGNGNGGGGGGGNLTGRYTSRSDRSVGLNGGDQSFVEVNSSVGGGGGGESPERSSPLSFIQQQGNNSNINKKSSAHSRRMSTMQQQIREQSQVLSDLVKAHIDGMFQYSLEDLVLRQTTQKQNEAARIAPRKLLDAAIGEQREQLDNTAETLRRQVELNHSLSNKVKEMEVSIKTRDTIHKQRLDGFLREVCILKEQLFRSYRDKNYVGKPVDLMTAVEDNETGEDVTIDQLLEYRKQMKVSEKLIAEANGKVRKYQEELRDKEELMKRIEDRAKAKEASVATIKREMDQLNELALQQREELRILRAENARMKGETAVDTANTACQATHEYDEAAQFRFENSSITKLSRDGGKNSSRLAIFQHLDEATTKLDELTATNSELNAQLLTQRAQILSEVKEKIDLAERERDAANKIKNETLVRAANAMRIAAEAEEKIEIVKYRAAEEVIALSEELRTAQNSVHVLRLKAVAVSRAHLALATRYQVLKTKNGLDDYKKKANSFHYTRAEIAVRTAQATIAEVRRRCAEEVETAMRRIQSIEAQSESASEQLEAQSKKHYEEMRTVQLRVTAIENASRLLLNDYERLRDEHYKLMVAGGVGVDTAGGSSRPGSSRGAGGAGLPRPGSGAAQQQQRLGSAGGGRNKSAAPLPPQSPNSSSTTHLLLPTNHNASSNNDGGSDPLDNSSSNNNNNNALGSGGGAVVSVLAPPQHNNNGSGVGLVGAASSSVVSSPLQSTHHRPITVAVKAKGRVALHEALERVLDLVEEKDANAIGNGGASSTTTMTTEVTTTATNNNAMMSSVPYSADKLRQHAFSGSRGASANPDGLVDDAPTAPATAAVATSQSDAAGNHHPHQEAPTIATAPIQGAAAVLPPLPPQVLLATSTLQLEHQLALLTMHILRSIGRDATPASAVHLLKGSSTAAARVGAAGYTSGNNLGAHLLAWAEGERKGPHAATAAAAASLPSSSSSADGVGGGTSSTSSSAISSAAVLAGLAAGSWSKLRTIMPAFHAVRSTMTRMAVIGVECPQMNLPQSNNTNTSNGNSAIAPTGAGGGGGGGGATVGVSVSGGESLRIGGGGRSSDGRFVPSITGATPATSTILGNKPPQQPQALGAAVLPTAGGGGGETTATSNNYRRTTTAASASSVSSQKR